MLAETDSAHIKITHIPARPAAQRTAPHDAALELRYALRFCDHRGGGHNVRFAF